MRKHTPGPWKVKPGFGAPEIVTDTRPVAKALYHGGSEDREVDANARLIAAAPDLLAVCEAFVAAYDAEAWPIENDIGLFVDARAAIAKARGGPS